MLIVKRGGGESLSKEKTKRKSTKKGLCLFPGYRWCGPGCSGPGAPVNDVDACCKGHDDCLQSGRSRCYCDKKFMNCLRPKVNLTDKGIAAGIMYTYIKLQVDARCRDRRRLK
jgi:hypothetical protein